MSVESLIFMFATDLKNMEANESWRTQFPGVQRKIHSISKIAFIQTKPFSVIQGHLHFHSPWVLIWCYPASVQYHFCGERKPRRLQQCNSFVFKRICLLQDLPEAYCTKYTRFITVFPHPHGHKFAFLFVSQNPFSVSILFAKVSQVGSTFA